MGDHVGNGKQAKAGQVVGAERLVLNMSGAIAFPKGAIRMLQEALHKVAANRHLEAAEAEAVLQQIMTGEATEAQIGALLIALRMKGETAEEIAGFARAMRANCIQVHPRTPGVVDTCGTGGDALDTFNISTAAAFVAAGAGVPIAKHGNRAVSSQCGSADVLKELGVNISLAPRPSPAALTRSASAFSSRPSYTRR